MTLDDTTLARALHDLAGTVPDDPGRLARVHHLARRRHRRQRAIGAGALAATMAAGVVGAEALASSGGSPSTGIRPASAGTAPAATPAAGGTVSGLPACAPAAPVQPTNKVVPRPTVGQVFTGGGTVTAPGTASSVAMHIDGGPLQGSDVTLTIGPSSKVSVDGQVATGAQLQKGLRAKFTATVVATGTYLLDDLRGGTPSATAAPKQGAPAVPTPPAIGGNFKAVGKATAATATTLTVDIQGGSLPPGTVTFTLRCSPTSAVVGRMVSVVGTRTGASTYDASLVVLEAS
ncbi:MAG TPA: hypothetical protein VMU14_12955 [Acidimicrobiales bacterium]|nr:hypothetical protein [Acidimicrobiales bacterium]